MASMDGPSRGGARRQMTQLASSKNSSMTKGNASRRSGTRQNNLVNEEDVETQQRREENLAALERQTFGSQTNGHQDSHQRQLSKGGHDDLTKEPSGQGKPTQQ